MGVVRPNQYARASGIWTPIPVPIPAGSRPTYLSPTPECPSGLPMVALKYSPTSGPLLPDIGPVVVRCRARRYPTSGPLLSDVGSVAVRRRVVVDPSEGLATRDARLIAVQTIDKLTAASIWNH